MTGNLLARLTLAGVLARSGGRRSRLRVSPRFLAHAEGTAGRLHMQGRTATPGPVLAAALQTWDDFHGDAHTTARFLEDFLADRDQLGPLRPVFPVLEAFAAA